MTNFEKNANFKIQCPFKKVRRQIICYSNLIFSWSFIFVNQGHYKLDNYTVEIKHLPIPVGPQKAKFRFSCKAQIKDKPSFEKYFSLTAYGTFTN